MEVQDRGPLGAPGIAGRSGQAGAPRTHTLVLVVIVLVAAYVRLQDPDLAPFTFDQARDAHVAREIVAGRLFPLVGVEIGGSSSHTWGPLYFYLLAVPFAISSDPSLAVGFLGVLTVAGVVLAYRLGRAMFGPEVGLITAALFATYPRAVVGTKALSNVAPVPLLTVLLFLCLFALVAHRRSAMLIPTMVMLAVLLQFHLSAIALVVVVCLVMALFRPPVRPVHLGLGLVCALALMSPFLVAQLRGGFQDLTSLMAYGAGETQAPGLSGLRRLVIDTLVIHPDAVVSLMSGIGHDWRAWLLRTLNRLETWFLAVSMAYVCVAAVAGAFRRSRPGASWRGLVVLALWVSVPFLVLGLKSQAWPHHFEILYPSPFLASAVLLSATLRGLAKLGERYATYGRVCVCVLVAAVIATQVDFHRKSWKAIEAEGAMRWVSPGGAEAVELMPIRHKRGLVQSLIHDFGVDRDAFFHRVHGSLFLDLLEDRGYFFQAAAVPGVAPVAADAAASHYVLERDPRTGVPFSGERIVAVGPYTITRQQPLVDHAGWRCLYHMRVDTPARLPSPDRPDWFALQFPTASVPDLATYWRSTIRVWKSLPVYCRATIIPGDDDAPGQQLVAVVRSAPGLRNTLALHVNGQPIAPRSVGSRSTFGAYSRDERFDLDERWPAGPNDVVLLIDGPNLQFDLDVHAVRPRRGGP